jgi:DNA-binding XRE family transcriptional regulator
MAYRPQSHRRPCFLEENPEDTAPGNRTGFAQSQGGQMKRNFIAVEESFAEWRKDPEYVAAYDALDEEFALAEALIKARSAAHMTQEQVAKAMGVSQEAVARLESGRNMPSTRTLKRYAEATGTRLRISFELPKD